MNSLTLDEIWNDNKILPEKGKEIIMTLDFRNFREGFWDGEFMRKKSPKATYRIGNGCYWAYRDDMVPNFYKDC